jgi:tetratricopeptide (TPR) repeat protein
MSSLRNTLRITMTLLIAFNCLSTFPKPINPPDSITYAKKIFKYNRYRMTQAEPQIALEYFKNGAAYFKGTFDTINYLWCKIGLAEIEKRKGSFTKSIDYLSEVLPTSYLIEDKDPLINIHKKLSALFDVYGKDSISLNHMKLSLRIAKQYVRKNKNEYNLVISAYTGMADRYLNQKAYNLALVYLDSSKLINPSNKRLYFVDAKYADVYLKKGDYDVAEKYINGILSHLRKNGNGYQTEILSHLGDIKMGRNKLDSAIYFYESALQAIDSLNANLELKPSVLEKLSKAYQQKGNLGKAYQKLLSSKSLSDSLFNIQSSHNRQLFEINTRYKKDLLSTKEELNIQDELLKTSDKARVRLKLILVVLLVLVLTGVIVFRLQNKVRNLAYKQEVAHEKNEAILVAKNNELTANALQIIEKEQAVKELLETIMVKAPEKYKELNRKYKKTNRKIWDDFHFRFSKTNKQFYAMLQKTHPDLTRTDLKHCALIKLNFDSKEMSHFLGISVNSVHVARFRIRKKLELAHEDNLGEYLTNL